MRVNMAVVVTGDAWRMYKWPLAVWVDEAVVLWLMLKHLRFALDAMVGSVSPGVGCHGKSRAGLTGKLLQEAN